MTTYFIGSELDALSPTGPDTYYERGQGGIDSFQRGSVGVFRTAAIDIIPRDYANNATPVALSNVWLHFRGRLQDNPDRNDCIQFFGPADTAVVRMETMDGANSTPMARICYWNGTAWTPVGTWFSWGRGNFNTCDIHIKIGGAGKIELFIDSQTVVSQTLDTSLLGNIARIRLGTSRYDYEGTFYTDVIVADYNTLGHRVRHKYPTANGSYGEWTGDWSAVDEFETADTDAIFSNSVGSRETFTGNTFPANGNMPIKAVAVAARGRIDPESPVKAIKPILIIGGNEFSGGALPTAAGNKSNEWVFDKNPQTNGPWTLDQANAVEFGVKATD